MLDINFSEDSIAIIGQNDTTHWVEEHFQHTLWTESSSYDISNGLGGFDVGSLGLLALLSLSVFVQNVDWSLTHILNFKR
jgi:hypothetical protein